MHQHRQLDTAAGGACRFLERDLVCVLRHINYLPVILKYCACPGLSLDDVKSAGGIWDSNLDSDPKQDQPPAQGGRFEGNFQG
jgi:hypothetical protein